MNRKNPPYSYRSSIKSAESDELINIYLQRPLAGLVTFLFYHTPITPNQVTIVSTLSGMAGGIILATDPARLSIAAALFYLKDILDSADGQLARAKMLYSRRGRFLDSLGDFIVNLFLFGGIACMLASSGMAAVSALSIALIGFLGVSLRVSYHVYYQTHYLHSQEKYLNNRVTEEVRPKDYSQDRLTLRLQQAFQLIYGWQDKLMVRLDRWCTGYCRLSTEQEFRWYRDRIGIRIAGMTGIGTEFVVLTACLLCGSIHVYLTVTLVVFNAIWLGSILYRRCILAPRVCVAGK